MAYAPRVMSPLTVLHLSQPVDGGVARVVTDLARAQSADGIRAVVACPPGGELSRTAAAAGAEVVPWPAGRDPGPRLPGEVARAARLIGRLGPDVVHTHSAKAGLAGRLAARGRVPTVHQPHAWSFEAADGPVGALALCWERYATRWSGRVVCVSEDERRRGREAGVRARWEVIRNGVDLERFPSTGTQEAAAVRARARAVLPALDRLPPDTPLVVCVGRLCVQKGQDLLLRAWREVAARVPGARLALVGDGPERRALGRVAPDGVLFAGPVGDPVPWYQAADLVVLPSRWEGMALVPLEAMACGRTVVSTDIGGARESMPPDPHPATLVPPGDAESLAAALTVLLTNPRLRDALGRQAEEHVRTTYDVRRTAAAVAAVYRDLLGLPQPEHRECTRR
ncbi:MULTISPECIES: glycosyltransferase [unclassified Streptomyces]|uniref:glycosyltransferase n=1 Tax=unclassified Streptomyces TaxID=2593676 RepID=UPI002DDACF2F|nr:MULTISPECIES: glycosyltransferase [unclassified Streptomyces]WSA90350.1 glycosyltransferase [Streptomyces sp. NBC_01795]WSB74576.1 glycosyltransferase [Streptomyces sp. NBC_01775]WSS17039.1 glycosyltransferase [Streptomyces sp. NBC_01186]WSS45782.1 glycosyltransferase [Streptomyces sp. NBC_01187]